MTERAMHVRVDRDHNDEFKVLTYTGGGGEWGVGVTFSTLNAALDVANSIAEAKRSEGWTCAVIGGEETT